LLTLTLSVLFRFRDTSGKKEHRIDGVRSGLRMKTEAEGRGLIEALVSFFPQKLLGC